MGRVDPNPNPNPNPNASPNPCPDPYPQPCAEPGTTAKSTADCRKLDPQGVVAFHQADIGEYLRDEDTLC